MKNGKQNSGQVRAASVSVLWCKSQGGEGWLIKVEAEIDLASTGTTLHDKPQANAEFGGSPPDQELELESESMAGGVYNFVWSGTFADEPTGANMKHRIVGPVYSTPATSGSTLCDS